MTKFLSTSVRDDCWVEGRKSNAKDTAISGAGYDTETILLVVGKPIHMIMYSALTPYLPPPSAMMSGIYGLLTATANKNSNIPYGAAIQPPQKCNAHQLRCLLLIRLRRMKCLCPAQASRLAAAPSCLPPLNVTSTAQRSNPSPPSLVASLLPFVLLRPSSSQLPLNLHNI